MNSFFSAKYFKLLQTFSKEEIKNFDLWLRSPWCNTNKNTAKLLVKVKKYHPKFNDRKLTKEKLFKQILPNGKYSDRRMNNILSEGFLAAEKFIIIQNLTKDESLQHKILTKELQNRYLEDWFFKDIKQKIDQLENKEVKDWEDHLELLRLHRQVYHHPTQSTRMLPGGQTIVKMGEELDLVYLLEKAAIINEKIFRKRILKNENHEIEEELKKWRIISEGIENPAIDFYKMRFDYMMEDKIGQYFKLRDTYLNRYDELNKKEQKVQLVSLLNDTSRLVRARFFDLTETLPLYKLGLKTGIILTEGKLTFITYVTIVMASNLKKDFSFTKEFIELYTPKLKKELQSDAVYWAKAHTLYREEKLMECLDILLSHHFKFNYFQKAVRVLTTQVYFDLYLKDDSYQSYLFNYFDSFEKWLLRHKMDSKIVKIGYLRFVQKCRALAKRYSDVNFQPEKVKKLLEGEPNVQASNWLNQKIKQVIKLKKRSRS